MEMLCEARMERRKDMRHENDKGIRGPNGLLCCEECGCTKLEAT